MKKVTLFVILIITLSIPAYATSGVGSAFGTMTTARAIGRDRVDLGAGVGIADATTVFGTLAYGLSTDTEGRLKLALYDANSQTSVALGADIKWQFMSFQQGRRDPFDLAFGPMFEFIDFKGGSVWELGAFALGSYPFALQNAGTLTPYARFNVRLEGLHSDAFHVQIGGESTEVPSHTNTDIRFGFNGGVAWTATPAITLLGEFQLDGNDGVFLGATFNIQ